jgi:hypothetical protein
MHGTRVGCLHHHMGRNEDTHATQRFMRWWGPNMVSYYDRGNEYEHNALSCVSLIPTSATRRPERPDMKDEKNWTWD